MNTKNSFGTCLFIKPRGPRSHFFLMNGGSFSIDLPMDRTEICSVGSGGFVKSTVTTTWPFRVFSVYQLILKNECMFFSVYIPGTQIFPLFLKVGPPPKQGKLQAKEGS